VLKLFHHFRAHNYENWWSLAWTIFSLADFNESLSEFNYLFVMIKSR